MLRKLRNELLVFNAVLNLLDTVFNLLTVIFDPFWFIFDDLRKYKLEKQYEMLNHEDENNQLVVSPTLNYTIQFLRGKDDDVSCYEDAREGNCLNIV